MRYTEANAVQRAMIRFAGTTAGSRLFARTAHHLDRPVIRLSRGRTSTATLLLGLPIVELTTTGARTGQPRRLPIIGVPDGERLVLVASNYGNPRHPGWYHNLRAHPDCTVRFRGQEQAMRAYEAEGEERERLWQLDATVYPPRAKYAARAPGRRIPVMVLEPTSP